MCPQNSIENRVWASRLKTSSEQNRVYYDSNLHIYSHFYDRIMKGREEIVLASDERMNFEDVSDSAGKLDPSEI